MKGKVQVGTGAEQDRGPQREANITAS